VARPVGGAVFGHYGDRLGRKTVLVWSLAIMGAATALVGLLPTYERIGVWAPVLLFVLRFVQGIGVGGEWGGAVLLAVEHSGGARRGLHGAWPQMGVPAGLLLATGVFSLFSSQLSESAFLAWGWRVPFLLSLALIGLGLFIRLRILETPAFERVKEARRESRVPLFDVFREHPRELAVGMGMRFAENALFYIYTVFVLSYGETSLHYPRSALLGGVALASAVGLFAIPFWAYLSDRVGRRPVYLAGALSSLAIAFPFFWLLGLGPAFIGPALILGVNIGHNMMYGPMAAYLSELFGTHVRYSGASLVYQLTSALSGGLSPFVATLLSTRFGWPAVAAYMVGCCAITATAAWLAPETHRAALE
jgi:MFS transporter, MHS family, shikimate and dehydroshikimate transport protein